MSDIELFHAFTNLVAVLVGGVITLISSYFLTARQDRRRALFDRLEFQKKTSDEFAEHLGNALSGQATLQQTASMAKLFLHVEMAFGSELSNTMGDAFEELDRLARGEQKSWPLTSACTDAMAHAVRATENALGIKPPPVVEMPGRRSRGNAPPPDALPG
jgi:hypothetical protein